jgi:hypothetical protein
MDLKSLANGVEPSERTRSKSVEEHSLQTEVCSTNLLFSTT